MYDKGMDQVPNPSLLVVSKPPHRRGTRRREAWTVRVFLFVGIVIFGYTYNSSGQIIGLDNNNNNNNNNYAGYYGGFGGGGGPVCSGGITPLVIYGCDSGVPDVDCGNNEGCLSLSLYTCYSQTDNADRYKTCVERVTSKCVANGSLRLPDRGPILACAATRYSSFPLKWNEMKLWKIARWTNGIIESI